MTLHDVDEFGNTRQSRIVRLHLECLAWLGESRPSEMFDLMPSLRCFQLIAAVAYADFKPRTVGLAGKLQEMQRSARLTADVTDHDANHDVADFDNAAIRVLEALDPIRGVARQPMLDDVFAVQQVLSLPGFLSRDVAAAVASRGIEIGIRMLREEDALRDTEISAGTREYRIGADGDLGDRAQEMRVGER